MTLQSFIVAFVTLLASIYSVSYDDAAAQIISALQGGKTEGVGVRTQIMIEAGNNVDLDFDNSALSVPDSWGGTSYLFSIGPTNGGALRGRTGINSTTGIISRISWMITNAATVNGTFVTINVGKGKSARLFHDPATPIAFTARIGNDNGTLRPQISYPTAGGDVVDTCACAVTAGNVFTTYVEYNLVTNRLIFKVNDTTVTDRALDSAAVRSIDTLVIGSSGGSTSRDIVYLGDLVLEHVLPNQGSVPTNTRITSPANAATNIEITAPITCAATGGDEFEIRVETVNPPVGAWNIAPNGIYNPTNLLNGTTYYAQCRASNANGTGANSAVSSFTTINPTSTTSADPLGIVTVGRQATWSQMRTDYLADTTCLSYALDSNQRMACEQYDLATKVAAGTTSGFDFGQTSAWLAHVPGETASKRCADAYTHATSRSGGLLRYTNGANVGPNEHREFGIDWVIILDLCTGQWTQTQIDTYTTRLNELVTAVAKTYANGYRCSDVDQPIANYFMFAAYYYGFQSINPTIKTLWETTFANRLGGITATTLSCASGAVGATARNMIARYYGSDWQGGPSTEGSMYGLSVPFLGIQGCEAVRALAPQACTEIDTYLDDSARYFPQFWTRDYKTHMQDGDNQYPHSQALTRFHLDQVHHIISLTGILSDSADRQNLWRWYKNFRQANGTFNSLPNGLSGPGRSLIWGNPYITASANLSGLSNCFQATPAGIYIYNNGISSTAAQLWMHFPNETTTALDHFQEKWGDIQIWHKNDYALTHAHSYAGNTLEPEGSNVFAVEGLPFFPRAFNGPGKQYRQVNGYECLSNGMYVAGTNGGLLHAQGGYDGTVGYYDPPVKAVDEFTQSYVGLVSADAKYSMIFSMTRINAKDPESLAKFSRYLTGVGGTCNYLITCYTSHSYFLSEQQHIQDYPRWTSFLQQWVDTLPVVDAVNKITSWTLATGNLVKDFFLSPTTVDITLERLDSLITFGNTTNGGDGIPFNSEKKYRTKTESNIADVDWNPIQRAVVAYDSDATAPIFTVLAPTGGCGAVLMKWGSNNNVLFIFNVTAGATITQTVPTQAQAAAVLATARFRATETCTVNWTATTSTTQILVMDRLPASSWTYNLNAAGAVALAETASGFKELSASGIQAHSLVIIGS